MTRRPATDLLPCAAGDWQSPALSRLSPGLFPARSRLQSFQTGAGRTRGAATARST
jgi:hypothetical protein